MSDLDPIIIDSDKIKIHFVDGGDDKAELKKFYFYPTDTVRVYTFRYEGNNRPLQDGIRSGSSFQFEHQGLTWTIGDPGDRNDFIISDRFAAGTWHAKKEDDESDGENGTFQAQSGGGGAGLEKKTATSANA